ncbi:MAG: Tyrosine--tRNA ligase [Chlamydiia bacterium]|nr:Tyrosine--tRNA ligase [Chlamydiia bacterium]
MNENIIKHLKKRNFIDALTSDELIKRADKPLKFYIGFDPTAESLHLGNLVGIVALTWFQKFGHTPVVLLGGATGKIGDPSGKSKERPVLTKELLKHNVSSIKKQLENFLDFDHPTAKPLVLNNDDWFSKISFTDFLRDVGKQFRIGSMLGKESVRARLQSEEGMSFTEFSYQTLQAYDFCYLYKEHDVCLEIGGSDQWGNITAGMDYTKKETGDSVHGMTFPLLTRSDGQKFGKSEGGALWLSQDLCSPYRFYQYLYRVADADVINLLKMLTFIDIEEIEEMEKQMEDGTLPPNAAQKRLAEEVTRFVHKEEGLQTAIKVTKAASPGSTATLDLSTLKEIKEDIPSASLKVNDVVGKKYVEVIVSAELLQSKGEAVRLIKNGGAYLNNKKVEDPAFMLEKADLIGGEFLLVSAGKKRKMLIEVTSN